MHLEAILDIDTSPPLSFRHSLSYLVSRSMCGTLLALFLVYFVWPGIRQVA